MNKYLERAALVIGISAIALAVFTLLTVNVSHTLRVLALLVCVIGFAVAVWSYVVSRSISDD